MWLLRSHCGEASGATAHVVEIVSGGGGAYSWVSISGIRGAGCIQWFKKKLGWNKKKKVDIREKKNRTSEFLSDSTLSVWHNLESPQSSEFFARNIKYFFFFFFVEGWKNKTDLALDIVTHSLQRDRFMWQFQVMNKRKTSLYFLLTLFCFFPSLDFCKADAEGDKDELWFLEQLKKETECSLQGKEP